MQFHYNLSSFINIFLKINTIVKTAIITALVAASKFVPWPVVDAAAVRTKKPDAAAVTAPVNMPQINFDIICGVTGTCTVLMTAEF